MDFPSDWGSEYVEADRIERHRLAARPDPQTGLVEDKHWNESEDAELEELAE